MTPYADHWVRLSDVVEAITDGEVNSIGPDFREVMALHVVDRLAPDALVSGSGLKQRPSL